MRAHPAIRGFERVAHRYERGRPDYPAAAVATLARSLRLGRYSIVVELGAGTGKFTRALRAASRATVVAVEPLARMREIFSAAVRDVWVLDGSAERIPLPDHFADAVVVAQAFHWFRTNAALREIARVLRPHGRLGLVWNSRDERVPWVRELGRLLEPHRRGILGRRDQRWRAAFGGHQRLFGPIHTALWPHRQRRTRREFADMIASMSFIANLPPRRRRSVLAAARRLYDRHSRPGDRRAIDIPYVTETYWAKKRD